MPGFGAFLEAVFSLVLPLFVPRVVFLQIHSFFMDFLGVTNKKAVLDTGKTTLNSELNYLGPEAETLQNASGPCASSPVWLCWSWLIWVPCCDFPLKQWYFPSKALSYFPWKRTSLLPKLHGRRNQFSETIHFHQALLFCAPAEWPEKG